MAKEFAARPARVRLRSHAKAPSGALQKAPSERGLASEASLGEYSVRDGAADAPSELRSIPFGRSGRSVLVMCSSYTTLRGLERLSREPVRPPNPKEFERRMGGQPGLSHWAGDKVWSHPS